MPTADEIFNSVETEEPHFIVNNDRSITVPESLKNIAVQYDHNIETITFDCPRYWDGHDLSEMTATINFIKPDGEQDSYMCSPITVDKTDTSIIHFDWTISNVVTSISGPISFIVCMQKKDTSGAINLVWHTQICSTVSVLKGIECDVPSTSDYEAGRLKEWSDFWDSYQSNGARDNYGGAFSKWWSDSIFRPKYDIVATRMDVTFQYSGITNLKKILINQGVTLDTSQNTTLLQAFQGSRITYVPEIDARKTTNTSYCFGSGPSVIEIDKFKVSSTTPFSNTFNRAEALEKLIIEGTIGQNGFNVQWSTKLTHESLMSILNALEDKTSDTSGTTWTITLGPENIAKLTKDEQDIASKKGWQIA